MGGELLEFEPTEAIKSDKNAAPERYRNPEIDEILRKTIVPPQLRDSLDRKRVV